MSTENQSSAQMTDEESQKLISKARNEFLVAVSAVCEKGNYYNPQIACSALTEVLATFIGAATWNKDAAKEVAWQASRALIERVGPYWEKTREQAEKKASE